ncbi:MAG: bifunctional 4-hydroxy-2-oxoglutarate aldolase/2-dehydro-3-deoxy-phosphogluconate aldolase [Pseudomonadota bacterium]
MTPSEMTALVERTCGAAPVVPVLTVTDVAHALPLAQALVAGGLPALEVTLRTPNALDVIAAMADVDGAITGAGTVLTPANIKDAKAAGATFAVSPGATPDLLDAAEAAGMPLLPGAASASEAMVLFERGYEILKFFPAEAAGGRPLLKSLSAPLPGIRFCPTGGVSRDNAQAYLDLPKTVCVGGSWVCPSDAIAQNDWDHIRALAVDAASLTR